VPALAQPPPVPAPIPQWQRGPMRPGKSNASPG
jgi:hypothetical protein